jgi:hypothetical protein
MQMPGKGLILEVLGRTSEADAAFAKAKELVYKGLSQLWHASFFM